MSLGMLHKAIEAVEENQPIRQPGERIGDFSLRNIRLRAGHSHRLSGAISNGNAAAEHPAECAVFVPDAMDAFKVRSVPVLVRGTCVDHALSVVSTDAIMSLLWLVTHFF